jgi:methylated-DNA-[protein]-cysteine S-methyltransferase
MEVNMEEQLLASLLDAVGSPPDSAIAQSRRRVTKWFAQTAPLIQWDAMQSPLGLLYIAASAQGLYRIDFGVDRVTFLNSLDPLARTEHNPTALSPITGQLREYFAGTRSGFDLSLDLDRLTPFQQSVLQAIRAIPRGAVWTYGQVAQTIGKPKASRAVGQALGNNPVPIIVPCHRVVAGGGGLGGYRGGLDRKRLLLHLEGAL